MNRLTRLQLLGVGGGVLIVVLGVILLVGYRIAQWIGFLSGIGLFSMVLLVGAALIFGDGKAIKEVVAWLLLAAVLGGAVPALFHVLPPASGFWLSFAREVSLPATALAAGALGQLVARKGISSDRNSDFGLFLLAFLAVIAGLLLPLLGGFLPEPTRLSAYVGLFAWVILAGGGCVYMSAGGAEKKDVGSSKWNWSLP